METNVLYDTLMLFFKQSIICLARGRIIKRWKNIWRVILLNSFERSLRFFFVFVLSIVFIYLLHRYMCIIRFDTMLHRWGTIDFNWPFSSLITLIKPSKKPRWTVKSMCGSVSNFAFWKKKNKEYSTTKLIDGKD